VHLSYVGDQGAEPGIDPGNRQRPRDRHIALKDAEDHPHPAGGIDGWIRSTIPFEAAVSVARQSQTRLEVPLDCLLAIGHDLQAVDERHVRLDRDAAQNRPVRARVPELVVKQHRAAAAGGLQPDHLADVPLIIAQRDARPWLERLVIDRV
jgi:hypothetical protein